MPSWYLLFLTTIGMYAVVRSFESGKRRWLIAAGICGGLAIAIKIVGIWFVAGALLALLIRPFFVDDAADRSDTSTRRYAAAVAGSALLVLGVAVAVFSGRPGLSEVVWLLLPVVLLCACVAALALTCRHYLQQEAIRKAATDGGALLAGAAIRSPRS